MRNLLFIFALMCCCLFSCSQTVAPEKEVTQQTVSLKNYSPLHQEALRYCRAKGLDTTEYHLIDMDVHSGKERYFVIDFKTDTIIDSGLVSHGCCDSPWGEDESKVSPRFNNIPESHCSSLGKYKIGKRGWSNWGINVNYKLHGLEATNSKAYDRLIVLHSWEAVSVKETFPHGTPEGWGCPAVSNAMMRKVDARLKKTNKDVLMWIYSEKE